jgi:cell division protein FtsA
VNNQELYAIVEINTRHVKFMVFNFLKSQANVLFTNVEQGKFCENGIILEPKVVGKIINIMVKKANSLLAIQIKRIALNLPSNYLTIRQSQAVIEANEDHHKIDNHDIKELIRMSKNISLSQSETICLTRPYKYIVDETKKTPFAPLGQSAKKVSVNSLIYTVNSDVYDSHLEALKYSRFDLLSLVLLPFSYG